MGREIWAEQALLGAVLSDPAGQQHVLDLVRSDDMHRPWHGQVLAAMRRLRERGILPAPVEVYDELKKNPDLPRSVSHDGVPLIRLMEAGHAGHASAYAAMLVESGIRRRLALAGSRMTEAAEDAVGEPLEAARRMTLLARGELEECRVRWEGLPGPMRRDLPAPSGTARDAAVAQQARVIREEIARVRQDLQVGVSVGAGERLRLIGRQLANAAALVAGERERQAQGHVPGAARPSGPDAEAAGAAVLRELTAGPGQLSVVADWLAPEDFAVAEDGQVYAVMRDLDVAGMPVDPVTISWEAARRGIQVDPARLAGRTGVFAVVTAREVHRRGVLARVAHAGRQIQASTKIPAMSVPVLLRVADERLRRVEREARPEPCPEPGRRGQVIAMHRQEAGGGSSPERGHAPDRMLGREAAR
jgi:DnaB-like helicase N terminal domain